MSVGFFLARPNLESTSIEVIVRHNGRRYKKGIGVSIESKHWNTKTQKAAITARYQHGAIVNYEVERWRQAIERMIHKATLENIDFSDKEIFWQLVDCELKNTPYVSVTKPDINFLDYWQKVFMVRHASNTNEARIYKVRRFLKIMQEFEKKRGCVIRFGDIDLNFREEVINYMNNLGYADNYTGALIKYILQVIRTARYKDKVHENMEFEDPEFKSIYFEPDAVYLTEEELMRIHETVIDEEFVAFFFPRSTWGVESKIATYNIAKNKFLIGAYTGLRVSDFNTLSGYQIDGNFITAITDKGDQKVVIPLHPILKEIFESGIDLNASISEKSIRELIKDICRYTKINTMVSIRKKFAGKVQTVTDEKWKFVSTHTARRSFATNAFKAGIPAISIMKITGHKRESEFMKYIRISEEENVTILANHPFFGGPKVRQQQQELA